MSGYYLHLLIGVAIAITARAAGTASLLAVIQGAPRSTAVGVRGYATILVAPLQRVGKNYAEEQLET